MAAFAVTFSAYGVRTLKKMAGIFVANCCCEDHTAFAARVHCGGVIMPLKRNRVIVVILILLSFAACGRFRKGSWQSRDNTPSDSPSPYQPDSDPTEMSSPEASRPAPSVGSGTPATPALGTGGRTSTVVLLRDEASFIIDGRSVSFPSDSIHECFATKLSGNAVSLHSVFRKTKASDSPAMVMKLNQVSLSSGTSPIALSANDVLYFSHDRSLKRTFKNGKATSCLSETSATIDRVSVEVKCSQMTNPFDGNLAHQSSIKVNCPIR